MVKKFLWIIDTDELSVVEEKDGYFLNFDNHRRALNFTDRLKKLV